MMHNTLIDPNSNKTILFHDFKVKNTLKESIPVSWESDFKMDMLTLRRLFIKVGPRFLDHTGKSPSKRIFLGCITFPSITQPWKIFFGEFCTFWTIDTDVITTVLSLLSPLFQRTPRAPDCAPCSWPWPPASSSSPHSRSPSAPASKWVKTSCCHIEIGKGPQIFCWTQHVNDVLWWDVELRSLYRDEICTSEYRDLLRYSY